MLAAAAVSHLYATIRSVEDLEKHVVENLVQFWTNKDRLEGKAFYCIGVHGPRAAVARSAVRLDWARGLHECHQRGAYALRGRRSAMTIDLLAKTPDQIICFPYASRELDPETSVDQREIRALLEHAIDALPVACRGGVVARLSMSIEETADLFGILQRTVKARLHRGRALLQLEMKKITHSVFGDAFPFAGRHCDRVMENVLARLGLS